MCSENDQAVAARTLADQLRENDEAIWARVDTDVVPRVLAALRRQFGSGRHWLDPEGAARSAVGTAIRRLHERADPKLETLETVESFLRWLVVTARNKYREQLRRAGVEQKHAIPLAELLGDRGRDLLDGVAHEAAEQVVQRFRESLSDPTDLTIFDGKLGGKGEVEIADELGCSTKKVRDRWKRIRNRLRKGGPG
jgi:DNA-directed RNA polymerase specialized sigma24 family protein